MQTRWTFRGAAGEHRVFEQWEHQPRKAAAADPGAANGARQHGRQVQRARRAKAIHTAALERRADRYLVGWEGRGRQVDAHEVEAAFRGQRVGGPFDWRGSGFEPIDQTVLDL